jgi:hypothetical protein
MWGGGRVITDNLDKEAKKKKDRHCQQVTKKQGESGERKGRL